MHMRPHTDSPTVYDGVLLPYSVVILPIGPVRLTTDWSPASEGAANRPRATPHYPIRIR